MKLYALLLAALVFIVTGGSLTVASAQTPADQDQLTNAACAELSLGGQKTYPADSDGDRKPDVCSVPSTRREAIARQLASEQLSLSLPVSFLGLVIEECRFLTRHDYGDSTAALEQDVCSTQNLTPLSPLAFHLRPFYTGLITSPSYCANLSLGGPRTHPLDSDGDGKADSCQMLATRREAVVRQSAYLKLAGLFTGDFETALTRACAALIQEGTNYGDSLADLSRDICSTLVKVVEETTPGTGGGGGSPGTSPGIQVPQTTVPGAPTQLRITDGHESLTVSWSAPSSNGGAAITDYDVQYQACTYTSDLTCADNSTATWGGWTNRTGETDTDTATTATLTGLTNGTAYQIKVRAQNSIGEGPWSAEGQATPSPQAPSAPAAPTLTVGNSSLGVSWNAPAANGSNITGYNVQIRTGNNNFAAPTGGTCATTLSGSTTSCNITGLTNGTSYDVRVAATNTIADGDWSPSASATPATTPDAPSAPTLTVMNESLGVSWSALNNNNNGGAAITDYDVQYSSNNGSTWTEWNASDNSTTTTATITGLNNATVYQVQVRAANSQGDGPWSNSATATPAAVPDAPSAPSLTAGNAQVGVSWSAPGNNGSNITDYDVQYRACTADDKTCANSPNWGNWRSHTHSGTSTTATITNLDNGTAYQVQVRAENSQGDGPYSGSGQAIPEVAPGKPNITSLTAGNAQITATWSAPTNSGSDITDYDVQYSSNNGSTWTEWNANNTSTATTATITGLTNGTAYQVQVRATNTLTGTWSDSATATPDVAPGKPNPPSLTAGNAQLAVSWSEPTSNSGSAITDYDVRYSSNSGSSWMELSDTNDSTATTATITGLDNGTAYQVQVRAENALTGSWSNSATATTPDKPDAPAAPTLHIGNGALRAEWSAPADNGSAITDYDVRVSSDNGSSWTELSDTDDSTATTVTISNLTNGTAYQVQVRAGNSIGDGDWSSSATATPSTKPLTPTFWMAVQAHNFSLNMETTFATSITGWQWQYKVNPKVYDWWRGLHTINTTNKKYTLTNPNPPKGLSNNVPYAFRVRVCASTCPSSDDATDATTSGWVQISFVAPDHPPETINPPTHIFHPD